MEVDTTRELLGIKLKILKLKLKLFGDKPEIHRVEP
jgi:hypothetical protein